jgi:predicted nucleic acid-binding Zn ribbon protein
MFQSITARPKRNCPECGKPGLRRLIGTGAGVIFKGSGFYQTDYRTESYTEAAKKEKEAGEKKGEKKESAKEGKSEVKATENSGETKKTRDQRGKKPGQ